MLRIGKSKPIKQNVVRLGNKATGIPKFLGKKATPLIRVNKLPGQV